ncbi:MAG: hypothetical protein AMJ78_01445 [Omnitrophica WOR_2 bacterium SM23_29]|nr:MAG: hypothetical protein AMJ78_01445 [Omnitrophica WOR_2 bacterium SM23_29]
MKLKIIKTFIFSIIFFITFGRAFAAEDLLGAHIYNELGVKALQDEAIDSAISCFEQAHRFAPRNSTIKKNLSAAYYRKGEIEYTARRLSYAERYLKVSLENDPDNIDALFLMGDLKYLSQRMNEAKEMWEKVLKLNPNHPNADLVKEKLDKLEREAKVEKDYRSTGMDRFDIRYSREGVRLSYNIRYYLQEAYRLIGGDFNHRPNNKIVVLIYDKTDFESIGEWREGAVGVYDGKIRLPLIGADFTSDRIRSIVWHEYTHVVIGDITKGSCPIWLNEGLAKWEEFAQLKGDLSLLKRAVKRDEGIPFKDLDPTFLDPADETQFELAYQESYTLANYLIRRYSKYKIRKILDRLGKGEPFESAIRYELNLSTAEFEKRWMNDLKAGKLY